MRDSIPLLNEAKIGGGEGGDPCAAGAWHGRGQVRDARTNETETLPIRHLFSMIRASPNTEWLMGAVALDGKGFVKTGPDLGHDDLSGWPLSRAMNRAISRRSL